MKHIYGIDIMNVGLPDLNLLIPLGALLEERHVSRAATRAGISQPAMSNALRRLRRTFADELLVRGSTGYVLTPLASRLRLELTTLMPTLQGFFHATAFDPSLADLSYRLAGTDYAATFLAPPVFRGLTSASPRSRITFLAWHQGIFDDLEHGTVDLVFYGLAAPRSLSSQPLFNERFICVMAADHPLADRDPLTLRDYLDLAHIVIDVDGGDQTVIDRRLSALGVHREARLRLPYHAAAAGAVARAELVATLPSRFATPLAEDPNLRLVGAPREIETMTYLMAWHPRLTNDPPHRWLRALVQSTVGTREPTVGR